VRKTAILLALMLLAGCGNDFEWFPSGGFTNNSTSTQPVSNAGKIFRSIAYPSGVTWISDVAYDTSTRSLFLLAGTSIAPTAILGMSVTTGQLNGVSINAFNWPVNIVDGSTLAFDGILSFWIAGNARSGIPAGEIYRISSNGLLEATYDCPASAAGFCRGIAWDPLTDSFWSAASDSATLINYQALGNGTTSTLEGPYTGLWQSTDVSDVAFDSSTGTTLVVKGGVISVNGGAVASTATFTIPGSGRGDWDDDSGLLWIVDNTNKVINGIAIR